MFTEQKFDIPKLKGISEKTTDEHLKLYSGYVKNANLILEEIKKAEANPYALAEMQRRFAFEFDGMRNHEYYFSSFEGGSVSLNSDSSLSKALAEQFGSFDAWLSGFKTLAKTRGVGWAILYHDPKTDKLLNAWIDEQHLGHLTGLKPVLTLDMWEHSFVADYQPSGKGAYIEDFFSNINWNVIEKNFNSAK